MAHDIAMLTDTFPAAAETFIMRQALGLNATVLSKNLGDNLDAYNIPNNQVFTLQGGRRSEPLALGVLRKAGLYDSFGFSSKSRIDLEQTLDQLRPICLLAQYGPNGLASIKTCNRLKIRHVTHYHGYDLSSKPREGAYRRDLIRGAELGGQHVVVSQQMVEVLLSYGYPKGTIHLIPYGVPIDVFSYDRVYDAANLQCLFVGRLVAKKQPIKLIESFAKAHLKLPKATLTLIGDGPLKGACKRRIQELDLSKSIQVMGYQAQDVVTDQLKRAAIFLHFSAPDTINNCEGWPNSIAEAAASGLPVVSTNHAGIPTQIRDGETGFLVGERDKHMFTERIITLLEDAELRERLGRAAASFMARNWDQREQIKQLRAVCTP